MNRRNFLLGTLAGGLIMGGGAWTAIEPNSEPLSIDTALTKLDNLMVKNPITTGDWNLYKILIHCAQSVEYSMTGYPEHKSDLFKSTAGKAAFSLFSAKGKMTHPLNEAIPGAPVFSLEENIALAFERFKKSLKDFQQYQGDLAPHFAYGPLSKPEYEAAHVMHFNNHLQEIQLSKPLA